MGEKKGCEKTEIKELNICLYISKYKKKTSHAHVVVQTTQGKENSHT